MGYSTVERGIVTKDTETLPGTRTLFLKYKIRNDCIKCEMCRQQRISALLVPFISR